MSKKRGLLEKGCFRKEIRVREGVRQKRGAY